jgi:hypothetical protein
VSAVCVCVITEVCVRFYWTVTTDSLVLRRRETWSPPSRKSSGVVESADYISRRDI